MLANVLSIILRVYNINNPYFHKVNPNTMNHPEVVMIGLGYIGLPTAALIAQNKARVHGVDINPKVVDTINKDRIIYK